MSWQKSLNWIILLLLIISFGFSCGSNKSLTRPQPIEVNIDKPLPSKPSQIQLVKPELVITELRPSPMSEPKEAWKIRQNSIAYIPKHGEPIIISLGDKFSKVSMIPNITLIHRDDKRRCEVEHPNIGKIQLLFYNGIVEMILILDSRYKTTKGIDIGSTWADIIHEYGLPDKEIVEKDEISANYDRGTHKLTFHFGDDNKIILITITPKAIIE